MTEKQEVVEVAKAEKVVKECCSCIYWERQRSSGMCRRYAPQPTVMIAGEQYTLVVPSTNSDDWCGDWEGVVQ